MADEVQLRESNDGKLLDAYNEAVRAAHEDGHKVPVRAGTVIIAWVVPSGR
jgi:hypothetical protein